MLAGHILSYLLGVDWASVSWPWCRYSTMQFC